MQITASVTINAPVEKVFQVFCDLDHAAENISGITKIELLEGPGQMQVGTKWRETRVMMGKEATEEMWVSELTPNHMYVVKAESNGTKYETTFTFTFTPIDGGTKVDMLFSGEATTFAGKLFSLVGFLFKGAAQKALQQDLEDLKAVAERA